MAIDAFTIHAAIIAFPGLIGAGVQNANINSSRHTQLSFLVRVLLWTVFCYGLSYIAYSVLGVNFSVSPNVESTDNVDKSIDEIIVASSLALIGGLTSVFVSSKKYIPRILNYFGISNSTGVDDIWEYALGQQSGVSPWVQIRDYENNLIYSGFVSSYSDSPSVREVMLLNVKVYGLTNSRLLYDVPGLYMSMPIDKCTIEFQEEEQNA